MNVSEEQKRQATMASLWLQCGGMCRAICLNFFCLIKVLLHSKTQTETCIEATTSIND